MFSISHSSTGLLLWSNSTTGRTRMRCPSKLDHRQLANLPVQEGMHPLQVQPALYSLHQRPHSKAAEQVRVNAVSHPAIDHRALHCPASPTPDPALHQAARNRKKGVHMVWVMKFGVVLRMPTSWNIPLRSTCYPP